MCVRGWDPAVTTGCGWVGWERGCESIPLTHGPRMEYVSDEVGWRQDRIRQGGIGQGGIG